jgi:hypothetical protein
MGRMATLRAARSTLQTKAARAERPTAGIHDGAGGAVDWSSFSSGGGGGG